MWKKKTGQDKEKKKRDVKIGGEKEAKGNSNREYAERGSRKSKRKKREDGGKSDRARTAFDQIEKMGKSNPAGRNFDEQTKRHNKSNSAQKMKGEKTAETRERRIS